jgi:hypothetical protein
MSEKKAMEWLKGQQLSDEELDELFALDSEPKPDLDPKPQPILWKYWPHTVLLSLIMGLAYLFWMRAGR